MEAENGERSAAMMAIENNKSLESAAKVYEDAKDRLIAEGNDGRYVLVSDSAVVGVWDTYEDALQAGYAQFGLNKQFLVKKIQGIEGLHFTRDILACRV